ncbi:hypothetical protein Q5530_03350 [Saccharothrix sp. BKS2]|uniref:hypothetical protein n=1 Tax=Saccharothrix sp. BKS2 TaxID=3064400 RepID=UPI0039EBF279
MKVIMRRIDDDDDDVNEVQVLPDKEASIIAEMFEDLPLRFILEAVEFARNPERATEEEAAGRVPRWSGDYVKVTTTPGEVEIKNLYDLRQAQLSHAEFVELVELYTAESQAPFNGPGREWSRPAPQ